MDYILVRSNEWSGKPVYIELWVRLRVVNYQYTTKNAQIFFPLHFSILLSLSATQRIIYHKATSNSRGNSRSHNINWGIRFRDSIHVHPQNVRHGKSIISFFFSSKPRYLSLLINYFFHIYFQDPYTEPKKDTRNIAGLHLIVVVQDVQDVPPIFTLAPPLTKINNTVQPASSYKFVCRD